MPSTAELPPWQAETVDEALSTIPWTVEANKMEWRPRPGAAQSRLELRSTSGVRCPREDSAVLANRQKAMS